MIRNQNAILILLALAASFFFNYTIYICDFLSFSSYSLYIEFASIKLSDVFDTPALILVILSIEEWSKLRVYCKWEFTDFMDWIVLEGSE